MLNDVTQCRALPRYQSQELKTMIILLTLDRESNSQPVAFTVTLFVSLRYDCPQISHTL